MYPLLSNGDYVLATRLKTPRLNELVVIHHPTYGIMIKRIFQINDTHVLLAGENEQSISSAKMGWVDRSQIRGIVLKCIRS